jgi:hypothetical protein
MALSHFTEGEPRQISGPFETEPQMAKKPANHGTPWSNAEVSQLRKEVAQNTPTRVIALKHKRTEDAIYAKAQEGDISLKPVNQSPYGTQN